MRRPGEWLSWAVMAVIFSHLWALFVAGSRPRPQTDRVSPAPWRLTLRPRFPPMQTARALESALLRERSRRLQLEAVVRAALAAEEGAATAGDEDEAVEEGVADEGSEPGVAEAQEADPPAAQQQRVRQGVRGVAWMVQDGHLD